MTRSDQLRQALSKWGWLLDNGTTQSALEYLAKNDPDVVITLGEAARFALQVWEGDAIVIERDADGNWPPWALATLDEPPLYELSPAATNSLGMDGDAVRVKPRYVLDALASAQEKQE